MTTDDLINIIAFFGFGIVVLLVLTYLSGSRFTKTTSRDHFRKKSQIGKQNLGKTKQGKDYRQIVKDRNLEEAKNLETKVNPKVTHSIVVTTKDVREQEE